MTQMQTQTGKMTTRRGWIRRQQRGTGGHNDNNGALGDMTMTTTALRDATSTTTSAPRDATTSMAMGDMMTRAPVGMVQVHLHFSFYSHDSPPISPFLHPFTNFPAI